MSAIDDYDLPERRHQSQHHRRRRLHRKYERSEGREPRYVDTHETYIRSPFTAEPAHYTRTEIIRRPAREDSDISVEEVRRDFSPPGASPHYSRRDDRYGLSVRSRSAERRVSQYEDGYVEDPRCSYDDFGYSSTRRAAFYTEHGRAKSRRSSLSQNQKIMAAVGGAALAVGGKEIWNRNQAEGRPVSQNALETAATVAAGAYVGYEGAELYSKHCRGAKENIKTYVAYTGCDGENDGYYSSDNETVKTKRSKSRRRSIVEGALSLASLGSAAKILGGQSDRYRSRRGSYESYESDRRSRRDKFPEDAGKLQEVAKAALLAGATEAFRVRNEPGGWSGSKGRRVLTAAIGASAIDAASDHKKSRRHILEAVVGGLASNRLINGSRSRHDGSSSRGRSHSRSRSRRGRAYSRSRSCGTIGGGPGPLVALATAGLGALTGKKLLDRSRSRSLSKSTTFRRRRYSRDSFSSRSHSRRRGDDKDKHKRSKSVTDFARRGLAAIGIGETVESESERGDSRDFEKPRRHRSRRRSRPGDYTRDFKYGDSRDPLDLDHRYTDSLAVNAGSRKSTGRHLASQKDGQWRQGASDSESLGSSSEDEKRMRKIKGKQFLTVGLATVATIHAAHNVYQSMEKRDARYKALQKGEMTPEEARKLKAKATLHDAAAVGLAALGINGAISEIKEAHKIQHECGEFREKKEERHRRRLERLQIQSSTQSGYSRCKHTDRHDDGDDEYDYGPYYVDANPCSANLPAPPVGHGSEQ